MRMRPCPTCGGQGFLGQFEHVDPYTGDHMGNEPVPCSSCADMPWLPCPRIRNGKHPSFAPPRPEDEGAACPICHGVGLFKPDPETVERRCYTHDSTVEKSSECLWRQWLGFEDVSSPCDIGWVARPERLETTE